jgi:lysophospholipase L1-like esterase
VLALTASLQTHAAEQPAHEAQWERAIQAFEAADKTNPPPQHAVLFIGSSSIRLWTTLERDLAGHKVFNRGFGGSHLSDSVAFVDRIVIPYQPKMVLIYAGDNDIAAGKSPEEVFGDFKKFVQKIRAALPKTRVGFISIKPSPAREKFQDRAKEANRLVREYANGKDEVLFIDVFTPMLTPEGRPRPELFIKDGLHPNQQCYELWASIIRPVLEKYDQ